MFDAAREGLEFLPQWLFGLGLFTLFWLAALLGRFLRRAFGEPKDKSDGGIIISASLGLLALLLGFTVSMAVGRFEDRRIATTAEANAIGTFTYRTDMLPPETRLHVLQTLDRYIQARLDVARFGNGRDQVAAAKAVTGAASQDMWNSLMLAGKKVTDTSVRIMIVESANAMFDAATVRDASLANRLPMTLTVLLLFFPVASLILIGYVEGSAKGIHFMASTEMILLLTLVLLLIGDLDRPRSGTIVNSQQTLLDVRDQISAALARAQALPPSGE